MWVETDDTNFSARTGDTGAVKEIFTAKNKEIKKALALFDWKTNIKQQYRHINFK